MVPSWTPRRLCDRLPFARLSRWTYIPLYVAESSRFDEGKLSLLFVASRRVAIVVIDVFHFIMFVCRNKEASEDLSALSCERSDTTVDYHCTEYLLEYSWYEMCRVVDQRTGAASAHCVSRESNVRMCVGTLSMLICPHGRQQHCSNMKRYCNQHNALHSSVSWRPT